MLLVEESHRVGVEGLEPRFPVDGLEALAARAREADAQHAGIIATTEAFHVRRTASARLDPAANLLVIRGHLRRAHGLLAEL
jgi:hypothetical protein